jgi:hypothetical protein
MHTTANASKALLRVPLSFIVNGLSTAACRVMATTPFNASLTLGKNNESLFRIQNSGVAKQHQKSKQPAYR